MKTLLGFALVLTLQTASAFEIQVSHIEKVQGMDRKFLLKTSIEDKVHLDCQSFIQGLTIGETPEPSVMMSAQECETLYHSITATLKRHQKHCLDVQQDVRDYVCN